MFNGEGKFKFVNKITKYSENKTKYEFLGEFQNNLRHGHGKMIFPDTSIFIGNWIDNKATEGTFTDKKAVSKKGTKAAKMVNHILDDP